MFQNFSKSLTFFIILKINLNAFLCQELIAIQYDSHYKAYVVETSNNRTYFSLSEIEELSSIKHTYITRWKNIC